MSNDPKTAWYDRQPSVNALRAERRPSVRLAGILVGMQRPQLAAGKNPIAINRRRGRPLLPYRHCQAALYRLRQLARASRRETVHPDPVPHRPFTGCPGSNPRRLADNCLNVD